MASVRNQRRLQPFDPRFVERHPLFWPLTRAARPFAAAHEWPSVAEWNAVFAGPGEAPVTFEPAPPRPRRGRRPPLDPTRLYDANIVNAGRVPSRERHWHDFANALVWGTFPRAKAALHRRQGALVAARLGPEATRQPAHRTRAQDGLAMIDEGGVVALEAAGAGETLYLVFGHALYEGFVLGTPRMTARVVRVAVGGIEREPLGQADAALAAWLADGAVSTMPEDLPRVWVPDGVAAGWAAPA